MEVVAMVLAGGRSARLGGVPKSSLLFEGRTLLQRTLAAVQDARRVVIVGDKSLVPCGARGGAAGGPARVLVTREEPHFGGPAAAVAAGLDALLAAPAGADPEFVVVLACDMPHVARAVGALLAAAVMLRDDEDGVMAVDEGGRAQYLAAVYRTRSLRAAVDAARQKGPLENRSARDLFAGLAVRDVGVPADSSRDVDTPADAAWFGITVQADTDITRSTVRNPTMTAASPADDQAAVLRRWAVELTARLAADMAAHGASGASSAPGGSVGAADSATAAVDIDRVLALAGVAAHAVVRPAAPLTTYLVGYFAGLAVAAGAGPTDAFDRANAVAAELASAWQSAPHDEHHDSSGSGAPGGGQ